MDARTVTSLAITPVKGTRLQPVEEIELERNGACGDREFFVVDERERMVNGKQIGELQTVISAYDRRSRRLALVFPDGSRVEDVVRTGAEVSARAYGDFRMGREVEGPWSEALSSWAGRTLRLIATESGVDRGTKGAVSLVSRGSLSHLADEAGVGRIDPRRFRMLIEIDGIEPHAEDRWVGRSVKVGDEVVVRFEGHVGRCLITSRDPESGVIDLPTLDILRSYRSAEPTTEPLAFGIYGRVLQTGTIRLGDRVLAI